MRGTGVVICSNGSFIPLADIREFPDGFFYLSDFDVSYEEQSGHKPATPDDRN